MVSGPDQVGMVLTLVGLHRAEPPTTARRARDLTVTDEVHTWRSLRGSGSCPAGVSEGAAGELPLQHGPGQHSERTSRSASPVAAILGRMSMPRRSARSALRTSSSSSVIAHPVIGSYHRWTR